VRDLFHKGDWLGDYEIEGRLRAGGMATLFLGRRHGAAGVSRQVVIKVIHPHLAEDELIVRMFIDEARISSQITHSNVVYVEKFGEHDGIYYIVMEYVDGCSLDQVLRTFNRLKEKLDPDIAVHLALETAAGLHAAHETADDEGALLGVVHRDVSPSNILLTRGGRIKVIDFGIAKARGRLGATRSGSGIKGKVRYMSPEQAWGRDIDRRSDVYALGIVLWELLTCRMLFRAADDLAVLELVRNPVIPPPSELNPKVSPELDAIVLRATAKDVAARHPTALELRRELAQAVPGAVSITNETIGELVTKVRDTLGPLVVDRSERKPTTPARPLPVVNTGDSVLTQVEPVFNSESAVRGEVQRPIAQSRRKWLAVAAAVTASAFGAGIALTRCGASARSSLQLAAPTAPIVSDASVAAVAPADGAIAIVPIDARKPATAVVVKRIAPPVSDNDSVEADGVTLAGDPNAIKAKPKTKPKPKPPDVSADGTVLSP
jgi:eukaryotic-like serine/threonine-protein kinase